MNAKPDPPPAQNGKIGETFLISNGRDSSDRLSSQICSRLEIDDALGMDDDNSISGTPWTRFKDDVPAFKDDELCSDTCFWSRKNRTTLTSAWSEGDTQLFHALAPAYVDIRRGSCLLALAIEKPCFEVRSSKSLNFSD